jgi:preprotein translocase subunit SecF
LLRHHKVFPAMSSPSAAAVSSPRPRFTLDLVKHRWWYIGVSTLLLIPGLVFMGLNIAQTPYHAPLKLGIDFIGGTLLEYGFERPVTRDQVPAIETIFEKAGGGEPVVQLQSPAKPATTAPSASVDKSTAPIETPVVTVVSIRSKTLTSPQITAIQSQLTQQMGPFQVLQKNAIGPTLAAELFKSGLLALGMAYLLIVGYLTFRFQLDYALAAIFALVHDTIFVLGAFAALGYLFGTEINSLFVTGILTVIGFSVHDTIVVFDRLRENSRLYFSKKLPFATIVNISVNQTLARSINTSLTALLALLALFFLGGVTTKDFVLCMILGIAVGTFSSICVASLLLAWWRNKGDFSDTVSVEEATAPAYSLST